MTPSGESKFLLIPRNYTVEMFEKQVGQVFAQIGEFLWMLA